MAWIEWYVLLTMLLLLFLSVMGVWHREWPISAIALAGIAVKGGVFISYPAVGRWIPWIVVVAALLVAWSAVRSTEKSK